MQINKIRENLHQLIDSIEDGDLLEAVSEVLSSKKPLPYKHHEPTSAEIDMVREGEAQLLRGEVISHEEVMKEARKRLKK
jgi:hypothetical protein